MRALLFFLLLLAGCRNHEDALTWTYSNNLPTLDSSHIQKGRLENLDDLKGIDCFRLGMPKAYYRTAYMDDSLYRHSDTIRTFGVRDFNENCKPMLIFRDDTLSAVRLDMHSRNIRVLIQRLVDLYGEPGGCGFCLQTMPDTTVSFAPVSGTNEPYSEECRAILDTMLTYDGPPLPLYKDNTMHFHDFSAKRWPDSADLKPATTFRYYPNIRVQALWSSKRSLKMTIYREAEPRPVAGSDSSLHWLHADYYVSLVMQ